LDRIDDKQEWGLEFHFAQRRQCRALFTASEKGQVSPSVVELFSVPFADALETALPICQPSWMKSAIDRTIDYQQDAWMLCKTDVMAMATNFYRLILRIFCPASYLLSSM
jgi:hypothetical protein